MVQFEVISNSTSVGLFLARSRAVLGSCHISLWRERSGPVGVQREQSCFSSKSTGNTGSRGVCRGISPTVGRVGHMASSCSAQPLELITPDLP